MERVSPVMQVGQNVIDSGGDDSKCLQRDITYLWIPSSQHNFWIRTEVNKLVFKLMSTMGDVRPKKEEATSETIENDNNMGKLMKTVWKLREIGNIKEFQSIEIFNQVGGSLRLFWESQ